MGTVIMVLLVQLFLLFLVPDAAYASGFEGGGCAGEERVGFYGGEVFVYQAVGGDDYLLGHLCALGDGGAVADPDVAGQQHGLGQRGYGVVLLYQLDVVEAAVHNLHVPGHPHVVADGDFLEAHHLEVGAAVGAARAEGELGAVGHEQVGAVGELHPPREGEGAVDGPDALWDGGGHVVVAFADDDHLGAYLVGEHDAAAGAAEFEPSIDENRQSHGLPPGQHLEVDAECLQDVAPEEA